MKQTLKAAFMAGFFLAALAAHAATPQDMLRLHEQQAGSQGVAARGEKMFFAKRTHSNGETVSCTTCHTDNPKATGKTRANKLIEPIAPVANKERFTDPAKVEKWFKRNCKDVLERACTDQEKSDFIAFMLSVK
jgi:cytochrome c peroxidase